MRRVKWGCSEHWSVTDTEAASKERPSVSLNGCFPQGLPPCSLPLFSG